MNQFEAGGWRSPVFVSVDYISSGSYSSRAYLRVYSRKLVFATFPALTTLQAEGTRAVMGWFWVLAPFDFYLLHPVVGVVA